MAAAIATTMIESDGLQRLLTWMSPSYPVGAYAYSHGLEWAVEAGTVKTRHDLVDYVTTALEAGGGWTDLVLLAAAWRADDSGPIADLAAAWRGTAETALESAQQGAAFARATTIAWPGTKLDALSARRQGQVPYPVAVGAAASGIPLESVLIAYAHGFAANLVSAAIRLIPLGQSEGQMALAALVPVIARAAERAAVTALDDLATASPGIDFASMRHETQYTRLFRS